MGADANNHGRLYVEDDSYFAIFPQFMGSSPGGWAPGGKTVREREGHRAVRAAVELASYTALIGSLVV